MKQFIFTLMFSTTVLMVGANPLSDFNLKLYDNSPFSVVFDNSCFNQANTVFSVGNIQPGKHFLKVYKMVYSPWSPYPQQQVLYNGWIKIQPKSNIFAMINCHSCYDVVQVYPKCGGPYGGGYNGGACGHGNGCGNNGGGCGNGNSWGNGSGGWGTNGGNDNGWGNNNQGGNYGGGWGNGYYQCMNGQQFQQLKATINSKSFDSSKLQVAKQALSANYLSAQQVNELVQLMTFESSKLDIAKYAYNRTVDKQNYYMVSNAFTFESSISELNQYIASH